MSWSEFSRQPLTLTPSRSCLPAWTLYTNWAVHTNV